MVSTHELCILSATRERQVTQRQIVNFPITRPERQLSPVLFLMSFARVLKLQLHALADTSQLG